MMKQDIKTYRLSHGLTQAEMAEILNLGKSTVSMIESYKRELPDAAAEIFNSLLELDKDTAKRPAVTFPVLSLEHVQQVNMNRGKNFLLERQKECELELHQNEMKVHRWKIRYEKAMAQLLVSKNIIARTEGKDEQELPPNYLEQQQIESIRALRTLLQIGAHKPVLVMVKIEGLQAELNAIRRTLNDEGYGGVEVTGLPFG